MTSKPSALTANDFDIMTRLAERELAARLAIVEIVGNDDSPARLRKALKEIEQYEAHIVDLRQRRQNHV